MDTRFKNTDFFIENIDESVKDLTVNDSSVSHLPANTDFFIENIDNNVIEICTDRGITPTTVSVVPANTDFFIVNIDSNVKKIATDLSITPSSVEKVPANTDFFIENIYFNLILICEELNIEPYEISVTPTNTDFFIEAIAKNIEKIMEAQTEIHVSGTFIHAVLSADSEISDYELDGNATQDGTPTPDAPVPISTVTGEQTVKVVGKNLVNINATTTNYNASTSVSGQTITVTSSSSSYVARVFLPLTYEANRQMTLSFDATVVENITASGLISQVCLRTPDGSDTLGNTIISTTVGQTNHYKVTVTADNNTRWLWLYTKATGVAGTIKVEYSNIQLEYGGSETSYEAYQGQEFPIDLDTIELAKIGTYQDYIWNDGGTWKVHKEIGKVVYNGSESWVPQGGTGYTRVYVRSLSDALIAPVGVIGIMADNYTGILASELRDEQKDYGIALSNSANRIFIRDKDQASASDLQTWLSTHNTTVYYALATPTTTEITDETLLAQLNAIYALELKEGEVNISITATSPNLPATLKATIIPKE